MSSDYATKNIYGHVLLPWVDSLYWAVATMTSTGYGDITPQTQGEMVFSCCVMVLGKLMIGYVLGMVAATLANDESLRVWYEQSVSVSACLYDQYPIGFRHTHIIDLKGFCFGPSFLSVWHFTLDICSPVGGHTMVLKAISCIPKQICILERIW